MPVAPRADGRRGVFIYWAFVLLCAACSIWLRTGFPPTAGYNIYDDFLFVRLARYISMGKWLGQYDHMTLAKGMVYSIFIAFTHFLHVPLKIAEQIVYLCAAAFTMEMVRRRTSNTVLAAILFAFLAFNPVVWTFGFSRVLREGLYISLSLILVVLFVLVMFPRTTNRPFARLLVVALGMCLGLVGAAYWLTREEAIWLLPSFAVIAAIGAWRVLFPDKIWLRGKMPALPTLARAMVIAVPLFIAGISFAAADLFVADLNYRHYGIFETNEFRVKSFLRAYGALTRIQHDHWQRYVPFPKDARERAYSVSPAVRELRSWLDGEYAEGWKRTSCSTMTDVHPCAEVMAGWFMWELRGAVQEAGHYKTAGEAMNFYDAIADQINSACAQGTIPCLPPRATMQPPFRAEYIRESLGVAVRLGKILFTLNDGPVGALPSSGSFQSVALFSDMVGTLSPPQLVHVEGLAGAKSGIPSVAAMAQDTGYSVPATLKPAPDSPSGLKTVRFDLDARCLADSCDLVISAPDSPPLGVPFARLVPGVLVGSPSLTAVAGEVEFGQLETRDDPNQPPKVQVAAALASASAIVLPLMSVLGVVGVLLAVALGRLRLIAPEIVALCLASAAAVVTRLAMLSYITATSFPSANLLYASPASPFVIMFATLGTFCGWTALSDKYPRLRLKRTVNP